MMCSLWSSRLGVVLKTPFRKIYCYETSRDPSRSYGEGEDPHRDVAAAVEQEEESSSEENVGGVKLTTHLHVVPRLRTVELYLHS
jgi:hypothetical protein